MTPDQKSQLVGWLSSRFARRRFIIVEHRPADAGTMMAVRASLREGGAELRVLKGTLARVAMSRAAIDETVISMVGGPTAVVFAETDLAVASALVARSRDELTVRGGQEGDRALSAGDVAAMAAAGSRPQALAHAAGALRSPLGALAAALRARERSM